MSLAEMLVKTSTDSDGNVSVVAPSVGWWTNRPATGSLVDPTQSAGTLEILGVRHRLVLPAGATGRVSGGLTESRQRRIAVEYGQPLFELVPIAASDSTATKAGEATQATETGKHLLLAPTDGVFYRRPAPDQPLFLEVGATAATGQTIGLIEAMKTFNYISYAGTGFPEQAKLVEFRCEDGGEVRAGEVLAVFDPL
jgi:acetyl-CoA carboxylase biotin carboxyl carrier protein